MNAINSNKVLHVKRVHLANGDTLDDKDVFISGGFLIVAADREDTAPTWYNLQNVEALQEVTQETPSRKQGQQIGFFYGW